MLKTSKSLKWHCLKTLPVDIETALGEEISGGGDFNYSAQGAPNSSGEGVAYHGFSAKNEEVEIDHVNYYQAVDNYFKK